jgi:hypothetical protein
MKKLPLIVIFFFAFFWISEATISTTNRLEINDVFLYFKTGSSKEIAKLFDQSVLLNINGRNGDYSRTQAEFILRDFFEKYPPLDFKVLHRSSSSGPTVFYIGSYQAKGQQFRIMIRGNATADIMKIFSIDIIQTKM